MDSWHSTASKGTGFFSIHQFVQNILRTHPVPDYSFILDTFNDAFQMLRLHGIEWQTKSILNRNRNGRRWPWPRKNVVIVRPCNTLHNMWVCFWLYACMLSVKVLWWHCTTEICNLYAAIQWHYRTVPDHCLSLRATITCT
jgi:hypothetical protein